MYVHLNNYRPCGIGLKHVRKTVATLLTEHITSGCGPGQWTPLSGAPRWYRLIFICQVGRQGIADLNRRDP